jgi:hypothetical protein
MRSVSSRFRADRFLRHQRLAGRDHAQGQGRRLIVADADNGKRDGRIRQHRIEIGGDRGDLAAGGQRRLRHDGRDPASHNVTAVTSGRLSSVVSKLAECGWISPRSAAFMSGRRESRPPPDFTPPL